MLAIRCDLARRSTQRGSRIVRGLLHWPIAISGLAASIGGIWLVALYAFKYAPQISRARFDLQTSIMLELQQQLQQLHDKSEQ